MKIISWNVNGIRAVVKKNFKESMEDMSPDIICFQETKAQDDQVRETLAGYTDDYHLYSNSATKKGYSGTALLSKQKPLNIQYDMGVEEHDNEGRVIAVEYQNYYVVTVYTPNSGSALKRLAYRQSWDTDFLAYLKDLEQNKPVIVCGDFNVAHRDIDLKNYKANYNRSAGYMQEEIDGMNAYINAGFIDTFRHLSPDEIKYSWWSYRAAARPRNIGWRIDYFLVSPVLIDKVEHAFILNEIMGSDHCPVGVELK